MTEPFSKVLIANRGEIAVRIIQACRELGLGTVAVYSDADRSARHVREADEAVHLGPAAPRESYLHTGRLIEAARQTGAGAIHPGYGFLSEKAAFAAEVQAAGLVFIGPSPEAIAAMGDKSAARRRMQAAGVPVVPGAEDLSAAEAFARAAETIGYPVLLKAAAGGGGKGMRVVWEPDDLPELLDAARREAAAAFGDERMLIEKYIARGHHVEFQVLADAHHNIVHLYERECSIQRRHQKIIEESPSPLLEAADDDLRARMGAAAVEAARAVGYVNAGTVEFIVDPETRDFYFLEMNTRLQVEHPVTELTLGLDLVHWQLRIARGEALAFAQSDLSQRGHAIQARLYAEDPAGGFLPSAGTLLAARAPSGPGVRFDSGYQAGDEISLHYDPLIAKLIVQAADRPSAIARLAQALGETVLLGLTTNRDFLRAVLAHADFRAGAADTRWVERTFPGWSPAPADLPEEALIAAAVAEALLAAGGSAPAGTSVPDPHSPWARPSGFRVGGGQ